MFNAWNIYEQVRGNKDDGNKTSLNVIKLLSCNVLKSWLLCHYTHFYRNKYNSIAVQSYSKFMCVSISQYLINILVYL